MTGVKRLNNKISFYTKPFPRINSYYDMIDIAVEYGLSSVEGFCVFEFQEPDIESAKKIKIYADSKGINFPCFSVYVNLVGNDAEDMIERTKKYAEVADVLDSPFLHHTIVAEFLNPEKVLKNKNEFFHEGINAVREIYDYAKTLGVKTIFEDQGFIFNGVEGFKRFLDEVDREVGVVADFGNIYQSSNNIEQFIAEFSDKICHVHIKDVVLTDSNILGTEFPTITGKFMNEVEIGKGIIDFKKCFDMLKDNGYNGYYALEYGANKDGCDSVRKAIDNLDLWLR